MAIYTSITDLIGGTPLLELKVFLSRGLLLLSPPAATPVSVWHPWLLPAVTKLF